MDDIPSHFPHINNALLRCLRKDRAAEALFERIKERDGLWVMELGCGDSGDSNAQVRTLCDRIAPHRSKLMELKHASEDYTLHLAVEFDYFSPLIIPTALSTLAHEIGFEIEIFSDIPSSE